MWHIQFMDTTAFEHFSFVSQYNTIQYITPYHIISLFSIFAQVTAITYKKGVTVLDICSTQMLGAYGFLARVFGEFEKHKLSVDVLASSEVSISLTLDKKQDSSEINALIKDLEDVSYVNRKDNYSILTLITDINKSSQVLATAFQVFATQNIQVEMMSQGASKVNISFIVKSDRLEQAITQLHSCFFENRCVIDDKNGKSKAE